MKWMKKIKEKIRRFPMRRKMFLGYAVPVILVNTAVFAVAAYLLENVYNRQLLINLRQSMQQAQNYIESDMRTLRYLSAQTRINETVQDVLDDIVKDSVFSTVDMYSDYIRLNKALQLIELSNNQCHVGIYLPDEIFFTNDNRHFFPLSTLQGEKNYPDFQEKLEAGQDVFTVIRDLQPGSSLKEENYFALLSPMTVGGKFFVVKTEISQAAIVSILDHTKMIGNSMAYLMDDSGFCYASSDPQAQQRATRIRSFLDVKEWKRATVDGGKYYVSKNRFGSQNLHLIVLVPVSGYLQKSLYIVCVILLMILAGSATVAFVSYRMSQYYSGKITALNSRMDAVQHGQINARIGGIDGNSNDEMDLLTRNFDYMIDTIQNLMKEQYKLGEEISRIELRALQAQINPHFLYNTLDLINWSAMDYGAEKIAKLARDLGLFYRLSLNRGHSAILIRDELKHVRAFVDIENAHFENAIHFTVDVPEEILYYACLNITLQPFVENSIVHGIGEHPEIRGMHIRVTAVFTETGEDAPGAEDGARRDILFSVEDDGPGMNSDTVGEILSGKSACAQKGYGITNINFRLKICYGEKYGISYESGRERGTRADIRIRACGLEELERMLEL